MTTLWTPETAKPKHQCCVPGCGAQFYDTDKYIGHVTKCVKRNRDRIVEASEEHAEWEDENPLVSGKAFDPEALEWVERRRRGE